MPTPKLSWQFSADVPNMASIQVTSVPLAIEAVEQINVIIQPSNDPTVVNLQGAGIVNGNNPIKLLVLKSSVYSEKLVFRFDADGQPGSESPATGIKLTAPQIFTESVMNLIAVDPKFLIFVYPQGEPPADVFIYAVRDATP